MQQFIIIQRRCVLAEQKRVLYAILISFTAVGNQQQLSVLSLGNKLFQMHRTVDVKSELVGTEYIPNKQNEYKILIRNCNKLSAPIVDLVAREIALAGYTVIKKESI
jgi:hypothetical protein